MGVSHQIGSKHLKLPVTDDFAGVVKIPKLFKRDLPAKGDQIWYLWGCNNSEQSKRRTICNLRQGFNKYQNSNICVKQI
jgi:hypothetical protein